jgi:hypothetical protein
VGSAEVDGSLCERIVSPGEGSTNGAFFFDDFIDEVGFLRQLINMQQWSSPCNRTVLLHHLLYRRRGAGRKVGIPRIVSRDAVGTFRELRCGEGCLMCGGIDRTGA